MRRVLRRSVRAVTAGVERAGRPAVQKKGAGRSFLLLPWLDSSPALWSLVGATQKLGRRLRGVACMSSASRESLSYSVATAAPWQISSICSARQKRALVGKYLLYWRGQNRACLEVFRPWKSWLATIRFARHGTAVLGGDVDVAFSSKEVGERGWLGILRVASVSRWWRKNSKNNLDLS